MIYLRELDKPVVITLVEPEIPPNIGAVSRLCACIGSPLHIVGKIGFDENHPRRKRAGLDYWDLVEKTYFEDIDVYFEARKDKIWLFSTKVGQGLYEAEFKKGDYLSFGSETKGLPKWLIEKYPHRCLRIPMMENIRSLNLANSAAIAAYEAVRQVHKL
ncbi:MAG: tRNA (cytidine(34)-2'-O)-methyltransferase [Deltaproteobacteria bacterium]|nr:tRNA (cytidine(34)-2'-O)-methyltransferase [Deltaproteobacteria bacterium]